MSRNQVLQLYKSLLREGGNFASYNLRNYAVRRVRDTFKANKTLADKAEVSQMIKFGKSNLAMMKRQSVISQMYKSPSLIIENTRTE